MKFKIDENLSPSLLALFASSGHDAHSVVQQALGGQPDERVIDVCSREQRVLITADLDFSNILTYVPTSEVFWHRRFPLGEPGTCHDRSCNPSRIGSTVAGILDRHAVDR